MDIGAEPKPPPATDIERAPLETSPKLDLLISPFDADARKLLSIGVHGEAVGFDGVWSYDHLTGTMLGRGQSLDPFSILGAIAASTKRVDIGPLVANARNRHPVQLALAANTLQQLVGDRAVLGVGAGAAPGSQFAGEHVAIGTELGSALERRARLIETIALLRHLWSGGSDFAGEFYSIDGFDFALDNDSPPPIIIGASSRATAELAFAHGDGLNLVSPPILNLLTDLIATDRPTGFEISVHVMVFPNASTIEEQLPDPSPFVDRWIFAVPASASLEWIEELRAAAANRFA